MLRRLLVAKTRFSRAIVLDWGASYLIVHHTLCCDHSDHPASNVRQASLRMRLSNVPVPSVGGGR